ncbi:hypothetical protein V6N11_083271 [Hibiscus sabdariffa]|uniref:Uncharacterized protein n=1 Tax=Hibiscus sabdariffa TaxID=183260 RepID=A0ABR2QLC8_9ROSI
MAAATSSDEKTKFNTNTPARKRRLSPRISNQDLLPVSTVKEGPRHPEEAWSVGKVTRAVQLWSCGADALLRGPPHHLEVTLSCNLQLRILPSCMGLKPEE